MNLTAMSMFTFYLLWRVYELSMENVRYGEVALAQKGVDVSGISGIVKSVAWLVALCKLNLTSSLSCSNG